MPGIPPLLMADVDIVVDIDNTIADTQGALVHRFGAVADQYPCPVVPEGFFESEEGIDLLCSATPFPGAAAALRTMASQGHYITYVTVRPGNKPLALATERWLQDNGFPTDGGIVFCGLSKDLKISIIEVLEPKAVFEDDPMIAAALLEQVPLVFMKNWPYNRHLLTRNGRSRGGLRGFDDWDRVLKFRMSQKVFYSRFGYPEGKWEDG